MKNKKLFDKYRDGNHWERCPRNYAGIFIRFLAKNLNKEALASEFVVVDLGCGIGKDVEYFASAGISAMGLDNDSSVMVYISNHLNIPRTTFFNHDIEILPFQDNTQLAYFCINVMHYVDQQKVLSEIYRTLRPGGYAFIHFNLLIIDQEYSIDYHQKKSDVYELVKEFEIVEEKIFLREDALPIPHMHHIMQVIIRKI
jgi:SAM-dependent methyltransferase